MAITSNIYQENVLRQLAVYGIIHQKQSTAWQYKEASMFILLCSTDLTQYSSSFAGTVAQLLASGVAELTSGNGYIAGGKPAPWFLNLPIPGYTDYLRGTSNNAWWWPGTFYTVPSSPGAPPPSPVPYYSVQWMPSASFSFKSALLCFESPISAAATTNERSYPLVMWDFGGTVSGSGFAISWNSTSGTISWTR